MSKFKHSNTKRRGSVVYGSVGKGGLFLPQDFSDQPDLDEDQQPLITPQSPGLAHHSDIRDELVAQEREFLSDLNLHPPADDSDVNSMFSEALLSQHLDGTTAKIETKALAKASIPLVATFVLQNSLSTVSVFTVGHLGAAELAAVSMGAMTANIMGYATIQGIATSLDTLCPQAFGAGNYKLVGTYMQRCIAIIFLVMAPILASWVFWGDGLLSIVVPDPATAHLAGVYLRDVAPGVPAYIVFECGKRFLQAQGIYHVSTLCLLVAAPLNLVMNVVLVNWWGYQGAPIAVAINYWIMAFLLLYFTIYRMPASKTPSGLDPKECWPGFDWKNIFSGWGNLISLAIPGLVMLEAEFLSFEIMTLMASHLGTINLAAQSIGATLASLTYQVPFAVGIAASTRIANFLGAGLAKNAHKTTQVALAFGAIVALLNFGVVYFGKDFIARLFTNDRRVIKTLHKVIWLIALMQVVDGMNAVSAGCLRGQGQTKIGGVVNLLAYYVVGLPLSMWLTFYSPWKGTLADIWVGFVVALLIISGVQSTVALRSDFGRLVAMAKVRGGAFVGH